MIGKTFLLRAGLASALVLSTAACSSGSGAGATGEIIYSLLSDGLFGDDKPAAAPKIGRKMAADLPYASIGVTIDDNPQFLFVLANQSEAGELYTLGYKVSVVLRGGRLIRTQGLTQDVLGGRWEGEDIVRTAVRTQGPVAGVRWLETNDRGIATHEARCTAVVSGDVEIKVLDTPIMTKYVREDCKVPDLKWAFTNHFWFAPDGGQIWLSVQQVHPKMTPLVIETFRPAGPPPSAPAG